jgi:Trypsin-like peptidase domain
MRQHVLLQIAVMYFWCPAAQIAVAQGQLTDAKERWIAETCPRTLGPSLWRSCVEGERAALANAVRPDLSALPADTQQWVANSCQRSLEPNLYRKCMQRDVAALKGPRWPSIAHLGLKDQRWIIESCPNSLGPTLWRSCVSGALAALSSQEHAPAPRSRTSTDPEQVQPFRSEERPASRSFAIGLPEWEGDRPPMPSEHVGQDLTPQDVFRLVAPSVYVVRAGRTAKEIEKGQAYLGSAVAISSDTALTNCHVIGDRSLIRVVASQDKTWPATVAHADQHSDRCLLKVGGKLNPISSVRRLSTLEVGERVYTIGNPSGLSKTLGEGLISGLRQRDGIQYIQTTAQISHGSSGGALIDSKGALLGITTFLVKDAQNLNFAIAAEEYWH